MASVTLTFGAYTDLKGRTAFAGMKGTLSSTAPIVNVTTGAVMWEPVDFVIDSDGTATVGPLVPNDDPSIRPGTAYVVTWNVASYKASPGNRTFVVPVASGSVVDFDTLAPTTPGQPYSLPLVVSVNGKSGAVTVTAADVGAQPAGDYATTTALTTGLSGKVNSSTYTTGLAGKQDTATLGAAVAADATVRAAFVAGHVYNSDGSQNTAKTLHVVLTADGTDIQDLIVT